MELLSLSPLDGRYKNNVEELREYFSEYALNRYRVQIEIDYLFFLQNIFDSFSASSKLLPTKTTLAFKSLTAFTLIKGVVFGMKIVALMPSSFAE